MTRPEMNRYDTPPAWSWWRHLDFGRFRVEVRAGLRRLACPEHGVIIEAVPFAGHRARFTRDFEHMTAFCVTKTDKSTVTRFLRLDWDTVGRVCDRVTAEELDPGRLAGLVEIGVDEISWRKHHKYLTLVTDHHSKNIVWGQGG
jgi:transposase